MAGRTHADLICFSHLRWDFQHQRPQQLLTRAARDRRVYYIEEPVFAGAAARLTLHPTLEGVVVVKLTLPAAIEEDAIPLFLRDLVDELLGEGSLDNYVLWCSSPKAMAFARDLRPIAVVYDRIDEASLSPEISARLAAYETQLRVAADLVFTLDPDPYETHATGHRNLHAFPGGADIAHFAPARNALVCPPDQARLAGRRVGFFGVIDDRIDLDLVAGLAELRPDLQIVMVGPAAVTAAARLPHKHRNLHWLGPRPYADLPAYLSGWDVAIMPLAQRGSRPHNLMRIPEYLAAGRPVVATPVPSVVDPYRALDLIHLASTPAELSAAIDAALREDVHVRHARADRWLGALAWDQTWQGMDLLISAAVEARTAQRVHK